MRLGYQSVSGTIRQGRRNPLGWRINVKRSGRSLVHAKRSSIDFIDEGLHHFARSAPGRVPTRVLQNPLATSACSFSITNSRPLPFTQPIQIMISLHILAAVIVASSASAAVLPRDWQDGESAHDAVTLTALTGTLSRHRKRALSRRILCA